MSGMDRIVAVGRFVTPAYAIAKLEMFNACRLATLYSERAATGNSKSRSSRPTPTWHGTIPHFSEPSCTQKQLLIGRASALSDGTVRYIMYVMERDTLKGVTRTKNKTLVRS